MSENTLQIFQLILKIFSEFFELWGNIQLWWSCFITGWMLCICIIFSLIAVWELVHLKLWSDVFRAFKAQDIFNLQDMFHLQLFSIFSAPLLCQSYRSIAMSDLRFQIKCRFLDIMRIYKSLVGMLWRELDGRTSSYFTLFEKTETCFLWIAPSTYIGGLGEQQADIVYIIEGHTWYLL